MCNDILVGIEPENWMRNSINPFKNFQLQSAGIFSDIFTACSALGIGLVVAMQNCKKMSTLHFVFFLSNLFNVELFYICSWREISGKTALMTSFLKIQLTKSGSKWASNPQIRDKRVTEIDYQLKYAIFSTACSIVYKYCTRPSKNLYSGI